MRELEGAAARREQLGERQSLLVRVEPPQHAVRLAAPGDANLHAVRLFQVPREAGRDLPGVEARLPPKLFGALLQLGKMVVVLLNQIVDFLGRKLRPIDAPDALFSGDDL